TAGPTGPPPSLDAGFPFERRAVRVIRFLPGVRYLTKFNPRRGIMRRIVKFTTVVLALGVLAVALASVAPRSANAAVAALVQVANFPAMQAVTGTVTVANTSSNPLFNRD